MSSTSIVLIDCELYLWQKPPTDWQGIAIYHYSLSVFNLLDIVQIDESSSVDENETLILDDFKEPFDASFILNGFAGFCDNLAVPRYMTNIKNIPVGDAMYITIVEYSQAASWLLLMLLHGGTKCFTQIFLPSPFGQIAQRLHAVAIRRKFIMGSHKDEHGIG